MLLLNIAPVVSDINSDKVVPFTVIASASRVPAISTSPSISKELASISPLALNIIVSVSSTLKIVSGQKIVLNADDKVYAYASAAHCDVIAGILQEVG